MKQCPKCNSACEDDDIVCKNCGYLFTPTGFDDSVPPQGNIGSPNVIPPQGNFSSPDAAPPQSSSNWENPYNTAPNTNGSYKESASNGMSIASLVLGIIGVVFSCCYAVGIIPAIVSLILGIISMKRIKKSQGAQKGHGMALAGIILSIVAIVISVYIIVSIIVNRDEIMNILQNAIQQYKNNASSLS